MLYKSLIYIVLAIQVIDLYMQKLMLLYWHGFKSLNYCFVQLKYHVYLLLCAILFYLCKFSVTI